MKMKRFTNDRNLGCSTLGRGENDVRIVHALLLAATALVEAAGSPPLAVQRITVTVPNPDRVQVTVHAARSHGVASGVTGQRLRLGEVPVPIDSAVDVTVGGGETQIDFEVKLRAVPEAVLGLDPNRMPVLWEGLGAGGTPVLAVGGTIDLGDPGEVELPLVGLYRAYARLSDVKLTPSLAAVSVHALLSLYNPFGFEVVATGLEYRLVVGSQTVLSAQRPGFRLRACQRSDVLIEQDVPFGDVAGGAAAFLRGEPALLEGTLTVRTPQGDRAIPLQLRAGM
jgi:hypothetical protein